MPASLALVKAYWDGEERQRAVSFWSMGTWGGAGFAALFGGLMAENFGWRWIFFMAAAVSVLGMYMIAGTPESKADTGEEYRFDFAGVITFMVMMVAIQVVMTQGGTFGWFSLTTIALSIAAVVFAVLFVRVENRTPHAFVDFALFRNKVYTGATVSNFLLNATAGIIVVAMALMQAGAGMSAQDAGFLTLGYAVVIVSFIRMGEKMLQKLGPRKPMIWGSLIVGGSDSVIDANICDDRYL